MSESGFERMSFGISVCVFVILRDRFFEIYVKFFWGVRYYVRF